MLIEQFSEMDNYSFIETRLIRTRRCIGRHPKRLIANDNNMSSTRQCGHRAFYFIISAQLNTLYTFD